VTLTLGIDIGTFESKGVLVTPEGQVVAEARQPHRMQVPRPGWAEHDAEQDWWGDTVTLSRALLAAPGVRAGDVAAVAVSAIGPCMLPVDAAGRPLTNGVLYGVDTRATAEIADLTAAAGAEAILARGGNALTSQSVGPKILWLRRNRPEVFAAATRIHTATSFIVERLTGEAVIDHYTAAGFSPFYDVAGQVWTEALAPGVIPLDRLPRLMWSTEVAGAITPAAAAATGLPAGIPVTCGTIDAAAEAVSVGVGAPGDLMAMYGSTVFLIALTEARVTDARLWTAPWLTPGLQAVMGGLATSGTLTHWFRDRFAADLPQDTAFATLAAEAEASPPGARGLLCLPHFSGERTPIHDPAAVGAFFGLNLTHGRGDLYRALLEGIAMATARATDAMAEAGADLRRVMAVGGGVQNAVWLQATADLTGLPQIVAARTTGAAYGDAFLAALAAGLVTPGDIARWNPAARTVTPQDRPAYRRQAPLFRRLYEATREIGAALGQAVPDP
jgi:xylulokinase